MKVKHTLQPFFFEGARVLILGTIPSPKSRETGFYYGHPQNRFWKILCAVFDEELPKTIDEKKNFLIKYKIALWDVLSCCDIEGASDASIKQPVANPISEYVEKYRIEKIFTTGNTAQKYLVKLCGVEGICLPSPSPANCAISFDKLVDAYSKIKLYVK